MPRSREPAQANLENLYRIFTVPEAPDSTLGKIDQAISDNLAGFLQDHIVAVERDLAEIEQDFSQSRIPEDPTYVSHYTEFLKEKVVSQSVHTASPGFIGHMTSALPYFMLPLARILTALNQNLVKVETSRAFTPMERQVLGMLHRLIYNGDDAFYDQWIQDSRHALGAFCSGGTIANLTALWAARNRLCGPTENFRGIAQEGMAKAMQHLDCNGLAVLVSRRGHYSLGKAADVLGIGRENLIAIDTDGHNRIDMHRLRQHCVRLKSDGIRPLALVGVAGTTETGNIDPLDALADLAGELGCHFHVDAAWGGPTLFSDSYRGLLKGIERADSVTIDAHKQMYVPMGAGMVLFKDPAALASIEHHAAYILREGSRDLGSHTLEGSRPGMAMLVHAGSLHHRPQGLRHAHRSRHRTRTRRFARCIDDHAPTSSWSPRPNSTSSPTATTRPGCSRNWRRRRPTWPSRINEILDKITETMQKRQRETGKTFVSRTRLPSARHDGGTVTVFRVVMANPLTTDKILDVGSARNNAPWRKPRKSWFCSTRSGQLCARSDPMAACG
jgi:glutamate decarboxylase